MSQVAALGGLTVLSCRPAGRGQSFHARVEAAGGRVVRLPLVEVRPPADGGVALADALSRLDTFDWIACTSVNGVEALAGTELPPGLRLAAVGPATAAAFEGVLGRNALVIPRVHTARGLVDGFPPRPGRVLAPLAELASDDLAVGLTERGYEVEVVTAYSTAVPEVSDRALEEATGAEVAVISSPSIATRLVDLLGHRVPPVAVTTGPRSTAAAADHFGDVVESSPEGLFDSLVELAARTR